MAFRYPVSGATRTTSCSRIRVPDTGVRTPMEEPKFTLYGYRWLVLATFMFAVAFNQLLWITFAPITSDAMKFYAASDITIGLLSIVFMAVYILLVLPAAWLKKRERMSKSSLPISAKRSRS